jgi:hypothetical protein
MRVKLRSEVHLLLYKKLPMMASYDPNSLAQHFSNIMTQIYLPPAGFAKIGFPLESTGMKSSTMTS